jgi:flavin reductase (DIM6/NTAB) family NADH-FMN oxidoreductase RutF
LTAARRHANVPAPSEAGPPGGPRRRDCRQEEALNADAKKTVLRMIPYGIYVLTADDGKGNIAAATVNWVTQSAFAPPLVVVGIKADSGSYQIVKAAKTFALNMLGKDQKSLAFTFFRPADVSDGKLSGQAYHKGSTGVPLLTDAPGAVECRVTGIVEQGDHHIVIGEVVEAHLNKALSGRPDAAILEMKDLGDNVFYGG